jgi:hypothetical protein
MAKATLITGANHGEGRASRSLKPQIRVAHDIPMNENRSLSTVEPVSAVPNRKLEKSEQRQAP